MEAMTVLDKVTEALERVLKGSTPPTTHERMTAEGLVAYAVTQIEKAANEPPEKAARRLRALGQTVEAAKQAFAGEGSDAVEVAIFEDDTTAAADKSEKETSLVAGGQALGSSAFAQNAEDLHKALARIAKELVTLQDDRSQDPTDANTKVEKSDEVAWPSDMNTPAFREGVEKAEKKPAWGDDPDGVRVGKT